MDTEKFEEVLKSGDTLAECFKDYTDATESLEAAKIRLEESKQTVERLTVNLRDVSKAYDNAKLALIGSVEAL